MNYVKIEVSREAYSIEDVDSCTIGELREWCDDFPDDTVVVLSHDEGYTYGGLPIDGDVEEGTI